MSGVQYLSSGVSTLLLNQTGGEYDIVSWDPRGVGISEYATPTFIMMCRELITR